MTATFILFIAAFWRYVFFLILPLALFALGATLIYVFNSSSLELSVAPDIPVRLQTAKIILGALDNNNWLGMGALSLQWNDGFHSVYNRHFFLGDVGPIGELYRFGFLLPIFYGGLLYSIYLFFIRAADPFGKHIGVALLILIFVNGFTAGLIAFPGSSLAILFLFMTAYRPGADTMSPMRAQFKIA